MALIQFFTFLPTAHCYNLFRNGSHCMQNSNEAKALVAIGMNGEMVILSVSPENYELTLDAKTYPAELALWPSAAPLPRDPGLYEFKGYTALEVFDDLS